MVADEIRSRFAVSGDRLHVIHSAVDGRRFSPDAAAAHRGEVRARLGIASDVPLFLLVGSGYRRKGVEFAIAAVARSAGCHLAVVGREPRLHRYVAIARRASVADRVHFAGPQADPLPWYGAADAFVLPTLYDPLPNAALEAMACALPVVTSEGCGAAELVRRWDCGRVCAADDVPALASHLEALRDPGLRRDMGLRARRGAATLQPEVMARQLVALYRSLLPTPQVGTEAVGSL
jgi:UDP-glucose:(heptosyl)LPS alpha-1,3-glucosyltransferase